MSTYQSEVYECARNTAPVKIDNSEWINEFSGGIKLNKGDNVRILGSFVHEGSSGEEIEVAADTTVNVSYSPYIIGATLGTADPTKNLIDLSQYADIPASTDSFGIEPPHRIDPNTDVLSNVASYQYPTGDAEAYANPLATAVGLDKPYGLQRTLFTTQNDFSRTHGLNLKTDKFDPTKIADHNLGLNNYENFSLRSVPNEFYLSQMVKKFILPMVDGHTNENGLSGIASPAVDYDYEPLIDNPVDGQPGMFSGVPKPGMCFSTVDVAGGSGFYDDDGDAYYEVFWGEDGDLEPTPGNPSGSTRYFGLPNLKTGCQSMIGTIIAVRPIKHFINGKAVGCFEILVSDWINPAQLVKGGFIEIEQPASRMNKVSSILNTVNTAGKFYKKVHGSGELPNGYNNNPSWNNINGAYTQMNTVGYYLGQNSSTPSSEGYETANYEEQIIGSANPFPTKIQKGYGQPQGLSFPWNGSHCGGLRLSAGTSPYAYTNQQRHRANSVLYWKRDGANIRSNSYITDVFYDNTLGLAPIAVNPQVVAPFTPNCYGAYLICNKETMIKVARGEYNILTDPDNNFWSAGGAGTYPRVWYDWAFQGSICDYKTRHFNGNSWVNEAGAYNLTDVADDDYRFGYSMCGQPPNVNWRSTQAATSGTPSTVSMVYNFDHADYPPGMGAAQSDLASTRGDGMPRVWSSENGFRTWATGTGTPVSNGEPTSWCGYNTTINSIHFQQKETGDVNLGMGSTIFDGFTFDATTAYNNLATGGLDIIHITKASLLNRATGAVATGLSAPSMTRDINLQISYDDGTNAALMVDFVRCRVQDGGLYWIFTPLLFLFTPLYRPHWRIMCDVPINTKVSVFYSTDPTNFGSSYLDNATGVNAKAWNSDLLMIREQITQVKIPTGFYTEPQLAEHINDQLHLPPAKFKKLYGTKNDDGTYSLPTNVGLKEQALCSEPSIINGNFLMNYIPDISYGLTPVVAENAADLDLQASTKLMNDELYTYDTLRDGGGNLIFYYYNELETARPYNGTDVRKLTDTPTILGKHFKIYSIPRITESGTFKPQIHLMRLRGGALNKTDFADPTGGTGIAVWDNLIPRWAGTYEMLRDEKGNLPPGQLPNSYGIYNYRTRLTRNLLPYGGGSKLFCGANNMSFSWNDDANRYSLNNLYTPIRPHERDDPNNKNQDFGIGDSIPSAIINAKHTGLKLGLLTGVYINDLNAGTFTQAEWGTPTIGDSYAYDVVSQTTSLEEGQAFLDTLGFSAEQVAQYNNNFADKTNPFVYAGDLEQSGTAIRVGAKIDTAINGSNPFASNCLNIAPVVQFFVEVDTDDFFASNVPLKGVDPYYFIGSDFPTKKFYGNQTGDKLPVIGICSRNFHSFNFVFDLGGSSISYTIEEDITIQSIRTKIYTSKLGNPSQLSPYSSVIYLITRNNDKGLGSIPMPLAQVAAQIIEQNATQNDNMIGQYYNPPLADRRFGNPNIPQPPEFYNGDGIPPPPDTETETDSDDY